jgi:hypothetical protein
MLCAFNIFDKVFDFGQDACVGEQVFWKQVFTFNSYFSFGAFLYYIALLIHVYGNKSAAPFYCLILLFATH